MLKFPLLLIFAIGFASAPPMQTPIHVKAIPLSGAKAADFAPRGWKVEQEAAGDLNADAKEDLVIQLIEDKPEQDAKGEFQDRSRILIIALQLSPGNYQLAAVAAKLLQCTGCGGMLGSGGTGASLSVEKGILIVSQLSGSRESTDQLRRFRYDAVSKRFFLIGEDINNRDRATGESEMTSTNYLTGKQTIEKKKYNQKLDKEITVSKRTKSIAPKKVVIEEVDFEK